MIPPRLLAHPLIALNHLQVYKQKGDAAAKNMKECELEEFAQLYFKYVKLFEGQATAMCRDLEGLYTACEKVTAELAKEQVNILPVGARTPEQIQDGVKELAWLCEVVPQSFEDHIRIGRAALTYVRTMMDYVVTAPGRPPGDHRQWLG